MAKEEKISAEEVVRDIRRQAREEDFDGDRDDTNSCSAS